MQGAASGMLDMAKVKGADFSFITRSATPHIGFSKEANPDVTATLQIAVDRINSAAAPPDTLLHTGDISQLSKPSEFDTAEQGAQGAPKPARFFMFPANTMSSPTMANNTWISFGKDTKGEGWYSFDHKARTSVGLVMPSSVDLKAGGLGSLGADQLKVAPERCEQLKEQHAGDRVCAHPALDTFMPNGGWGTDDS